MMNPVASQLVGKYRLMDRLREVERHRPSNLVQNDHSPRVQVLFQRFGKYLINASDRIQKWSWFRISNALG